MLVDGVAVAVVTETTVVGDVEGGGVVVVDDDIASVLELVVDGVGDVSLENVTREDSIAELWVNETRPVDVRVAMGCDVVGADDGVTVTMRVDVLMTGGGVLVAAGTVMIVVGVTVMVVAERGGMLVCVVSVRVSLLSVRVCEEVGVATLFPSCFLR